MIPSNYWLTRVNEVIENNLSNVDFTVQQLCEEVGISRMQLHRQLTEQTGYATARYIRSIRLAKVCELLDTTNLHLSEITYQTGFKDLSYLSRVFLAEKGMRPSKWRERVEMRV